MKASTHDGRFHADEIFALAVLNLIYPDLKIVRSRDENVYNKADIIVWTWVIFIILKTLFSTTTKGVFHLKENREFHMRLLDWCRKNMANYYANHLSHQNISTL